MFCVGVRSRSGMFRMRVRFMSVVLMRVFRMRVTRLGRRLVGSDDVYLGSGDAATADPAHLQARAHGQRSSRFLEEGKGHARIHQGAQKHVTAYAGKTLQISNSHLFDFKLPAMRLAGLVRPRGECRSLIPNGSPNNRA